MYLYRVERAYGCDAGDDGDDSMGGERPHIYPSGKSSTKPSESTIISFFM
jgi:hypothetical protein